MDSNFLDIIDMRELGKELQQARIKRGLTQEEAAKIIDVARTTITAIEKGERRIKAEELIKLAYAYGREVSDFIRPRPQVEPFQNQFRSLPQFPPQENMQIALYIDILEELSRNYLELEQITETPLVRKYPPEYQITGLRIEQAAMGVAIEERNRLGLGDGPIPILRGGSTIRQARDEKLPIRYQYLAIDAFDRALITEGQFAYFLGVDRIEARHIAEALRQHTSGVTDDTPIDLDMTQSLGA